MPVFVATCFAGPLHSQRITNDYPVLRVARPTRLTALLDVDKWDPTQPIQIREGRYNLKKFAFRCMEWDVWVYENGWIEDEKVERHIEMGAQLMYEIARAWNGVSK